MKPLLLVITADDLGLDPKRDEGILAAHAASGISQASLMVAGPTARAAAESARKAGLALGLHLDLTELPTSADPKSVPTLLNENGEKLGKHGLRKALAEGSIDLAHIEIEALAQIEAFAELTGAPPTHIDGHQHIHIVPSIAPVLAKVMKQAGVRTTRIPEQRHVNVQDPQAAEFYRGVSAQANAARQVYSAFGIRSTEAFEGLDRMGFASSADGLRAAVLAHPGGVSVELMCHPGYCGVSHDDFNRSPAREHELVVLVSRPFERLVADGQMRILGFDQLSEGYGLC